MNVFEILIPFKSVPSRRVVDANKEQIGIRKNNENTKDATGHKGDRKT